MIVETGAPPVEQSVVNDSLADYNKEQQENLQDFSKAKIVLKRIIDDFDGFVKQAKLNRLTRDVEIDVEALRKAGKLDEDETMIPNRVIDTNIQRELPPFINYLKNSRRLAIFTCVSDPNINDSQKLELEFTRGMTYPGWEIPFYKELDGSATHGWDAVEVTFDDSKPFNVGIEHIGHDKLFYPKTCLDIQDSPRLIRAYDVTITQLKKFVEKFGFSSEQVGHIVDAHYKANRTPETVRIFKELCKYNGIVFVSWFSMDSGVSDWLKKPEQLDLGISEKKIVTVQVPINPLMPTLTAPQQQEQWVPVPITQYPIFLLPYRETEKPLVVDHKGRVFLDKYKQEAMTSIQSSFVNGMYRATQVYASRGSDDGTGTSLGEESNVTITGNRILNKPVSFHHQDYPDPVMLKAMQHMDVANANETNQVTYAANNRQDSRKTAKEIESAEQQQSLLNSVQLTLFSTHIRGVYNLVWLIVQSQALQGAIRFLQIQVQKPKLNPLTKDPIIDPETMQPEMEMVWVNNEYVIKQIYDIRAAGDVDVIQRNEKIMQMKQDWPVVSQTVLKDDFLAELIRLQYPDTGEKWSNVLLQQGGQLQQMQGMLTSMGGIIKALMQENPDLFNNLKPEEQQIIKTMVTQTTGQPNG